MSGKSRFKKFRRQTYVEVPFGPEGEEGEREVIRLYPSTAHMAGRMRDIAVTLADLLGRLQTTTGAKTLQSEIENEEFTQDGMEVKKMRHKPVPSSEVQAMAASTGQLWSEIALALTEENNQLVICELILDSARDELGSDDRNPDTLRIKDEVIRDFYSEVDFRTLFELLGGWFKANSGEVGDLGKRVADRLKATVERTVADPYQPTEPMPEETPEAEIHDGPGSTTTRSGEESSS